MNEASVSSGRPVGLAAAWRRHFLAAEFLAVVVAGAVFAMWVLALDGESTVDRILQGHRGTVYGTLAAIFASLLGFVLTTTSIVLGYSQSERFEILRNSIHYETLWRTFTSAIRVLAFGAVAAFAALLLDRDNDPKIVATVSVAVIALLALVRTARVIWALEGIIRIVTRTSPSSTDTPTT